MDHLQHYPLKELMPKAFARPKDLAAVDELQAKGCTALVVACHCCLIRDVRSSSHHAVTDRMLLQTPCMYRLLACVDVLQHGHFAHECTRSIKQT